MSNGVNSKSNVLERIFRQQIAINKAIMDRKWDPQKIADHLQVLIDNPPRIEKFALLVDLGIITVPETYLHETQLTTFGKQNRKKFYHYNNEITDKNFPNPTRVLKPGDKLRVRAFKQVVGDTTTSEECMAFLATQKAIHVGVQGASLVWDQKRDQLPKGKGYVSFDEKDRLWTHADGDHGVPRVDAGSDGDFGFSLGYFELVWRDGSAFLCFTEVVEESKTTMSSTGAPDQLMQKVIDYGP